MDELIAQLAQPQLGLTGVEIADILWLVTVCRSPNAAHPTALAGAQPVANSKPMAKLQSSPPLPKPIEPARPHPPLGVQPVRPIGLYPRRQALAQTLAQQGEASLPFKTPNAPSLREPLRVTRSLRPLLRKVPSKTDILLDENATAQAIADSNLWLPMTRPRLEPWLEIALVIDESSSMLIWQQTVKELRRLLRYSGAFRDMRTWGLVQDQANQVCLRSSIWQETEHFVLHRPQVLLDPTGRRLVLVVSDCVSAIWQTGAMLAPLQVWAETGALAIVQMLPEWLWDRTALRQATPVQLYGLAPGVPNQQLQQVVTRRSLSHDASPPAAGIKVPVLTPEPHRIDTWSRMLVGQGSIPAPGRLMRLDGPPMPPVRPAQDIELTAKHRLQRFQVAATPMAWRLARLVAAAPVISLPVIRLIQETLLPTSTQVQVAEVLLGGILKAKTPPELDTSPDDVVYDFVDPAIRSLLLDQAPVTDIMQVLSRYIQAKLNQSLDDFVADLKAVDEPPTPLDAALIEQLRPFALITAEVLKRKGGRYAEWAKALEREYRPGLQVFNFTFSMVKVVPNFFGWGTRLEIQPQPGKAEFFTQPLNLQTGLPMVIVPSGDFAMGSLDEVGSELAETPQHHVTVSAFGLSQSPITQAQWQAVAQLPPVKRSLQPQPFKLTGNQRPVEQVSWLDAVEFCDRLSQLTGRCYRLPTEAEWEYACRAGTTSPFHFGETITPDLANYDGNYPYGAGPEGIWRQQTTDVGSFSANALGLFDLHGNVAEWCADHWHDNYEGAPIDGSAWLTPDRSEDALRVMRGGSWLTLPTYCRSAYRVALKADQSTPYIGFRVATVIP